MARASSGSPASTSASVGVAGLAESGVLVEGDLSVEREHHAVWRLHERVHLDQRCVLFGEDLPQRDDDVGSLVEDLVGIASRNGDLAGLRDVDADHRIDRDFRKRFRRLDRDLLDLDAAFARCHCEERAVRPIEQEREVVLLRDVTRFGDEHAVHDVALDVHAEDRVGLGIRVVGAIGQLHATGLAAAADFDLSLDDDLSAKLFRDLLRAGGRRGYFTAKHRDAVCGEQVSCLVFEQVHVR